MSPRKLIIVESYGKVKTIQGIVGREFVVKACGGHILDLNHKNLSIAISDGGEFEPMYIFLKNKRKFVKDIKDTNYAYIYLATDNDREGEFIASCLQKVLGIPRTEKNRLVFNEITGEAIRRGMSQPREINHGLVESQQTRRMLDRIIGYKIQPYLPKTFSVGRVQSVVVKMISDRCESVTSEPHVKEIVSDFRFEEFPAETFRGDISESQFKDDHFVNSLVSDPELYAVRSAKSSNRSESPPRPLDTVGLQRQCFYNLNLRSEETMKIAQSLYEKGLITYMRTSSTALSRSFVEKISDEILRRFSDKALIRKGVASKTSPDQAHEAVRPTLGSPGKVSALEKNEKRVYDLIYKHTLMACMSDAVYRDYKYEVDHPNHDVVLAGTCSDLLFSGFRAAEGAVADTEMHKKKKKGSRVLLVHASIRESYRNNRALYNEASLVSDMKNRGIGQPSTYSYILNHIQKKGYVGLADRPPVDLEVETKSWSGGAGVSKKKKIVSFFDERKKLHVLPKGEKLVAFLGDNFPRFLDVGYTSGMELELERVVKQEKNRNDILKDTLGYISGIKPLTGIDMKKEDSRLSRAGVSSGKKSKYVGDDADGHKLFFGKSKYGYFIRKVYDKNIVQFFGCESGDETVERARLITKESYFIGNYKSKPAFVISKNGKLYIQWNKKLKYIPHTTRKIDAKILKNIF